MARETAPPALYEMIKIPLSALSEETDSGEGVTPEAGDTVALGVVEGEVMAVEGEDVHVELKTAGGQPIEYVESAPEAPEEPVSEDVEEAELLEAAKQADEEGYQL